MITESVFITQLVEFLRSLEYEVVREPADMPNNSRWRGVLPFFGKVTFRPDILVGYRDNYAIVEAKLDLFPGSVIHAREYADHFRMNVVLCVPDKSAQDITESVRRFAEDNNVSVCSQSGLEGVLHEFLKTPSHV